MTAIEIFWFFLILMALQPVVRQRALEVLRQRRIGDLQKRRGSRVILLVHRQETMRLLGFPLMRFIDVGDAEDVLRAIHLTSDATPIDLVLHTPGGLVLPSVQIARALRAHPAKVTVFVPHYAMSGGTLIALAADEIVLSPHAVLGPVDPQLGQLPAASILRVLQDKPVEHIDDETLVLADMARKALFELRRTVEQLLEGRLDGESATELAGRLAEGHWTHDYPISAEEARALGLPVSTQMPELVLELMALYPQPVRAQPGVEYLPGPRGPEAPGARRQT
jgi:ClpP class serine protease